MKNKIVSFSACLLLLLIAVPLSGAVRAVPGYAGAAIYITADAEATPVVEYRKKGENSWLPAYKPVLSADRKEFRLSIFNLLENTCYEYRVIGKNSRQQGFFTTSSADVPVAENIVLTPENFKNHQVISRSGSPDGYIRYTAKPGTVLTGDTKHPEAVLLKNAKYIILDGLTIRGGGHSCIQVTNCQNIQIKNCDIGLWGTERKPYDLKDPVDTNDAYRRLQLEGKRNINNQSGIKVRDCENILIERNFIHDPMSKANSWFYTHPWGPQGIHVGFSQKVTIRWNDIIGGDNHRFNDVIESWGNGHPKGGPGIDAEIYGNYLAFCNDDAIELDGIQQNVRFFHNRLEGFYSGVSTAPCMNGPSYIVENLLMKPGDEFGKCNSMIKNGGFAWYPGRTFIFGNTFVGNKLFGISGAINSFSFFVIRLKPEMLKVQKVTAANNIFFNCKPGMEQFYKFKNVLVNNVYDATNRKSLPDKKVEPGCRIEKVTFSDPSAGVFTTAQRVSGSTIDNISNGVGIAQMMPKRPFEIVSSHYTVELDLKKTTQKIILKSTGFEGDISILQPRASEFFTVTPSRKYLKKGESVELTVSAAQNKADHAQVHSGAFIIRNTHGVSLPVSVYFDNRLDSKKAEAYRSKVIYGKVNRISPRKITLEFESVPNGRYYLFIRTKYYPYHVKLTLPGEKSYMSVIYPGMRPQRGGWTNLPWNYKYRLKVPRTIEGKFVVTLEHERAKDITSCALAETPEEILKANNN